MAKTLNIFKDLLVDIVLAISCMSFVFSCLLFLGLKNVTKSSVVILIVLAGFLIAITVVRFIFKDLMDAKLYYIPIGFLCITALLYIIIDSKLLVLLMVFILGILCIFQIVLKYAERIGTVVMLFFHLPCILYFTIYCVFGIFSYSDDTYLIPMISALNIMIVYNIIRYFKVKKVKRYSI